VICPADAAALCGSGGQMKRTGVLRWVLVVAAVAMLMAGDRVHAAAGDVVLYASDLTTVRGNWWTASVSGAAGGAAAISADNGWSSLSAPSGSPSDYFEATFSASAGTPYHVWVRMRAAGDSKWNDSVWLQFNDAINSSGSAIFRIGGTSGLLINLATESTGSGLGGWGWQDGAYWLSQYSTVSFASSGSHTLRIQTREDGSQIDQIVLSPAAYLYNSPGSVSFDSTIVSKSSTSTSTSTTTSTSSTSSSVLSPYSGTPAPIPGNIPAANFDNGGPTIAYGDKTPGNTGGEYRSTDVDLAASSEGGYTIGWIDAGEWVNYTVNVGSTGSYTAQLRVASPNGGGSLHIGFNGSGEWKSVTIPPTGGWQSWTTVNVPLSLTAGRQVLTLLFDTAGYNVSSINVTGGTSTATTSTPAPPPPPSSGSGTQISALTWNIQVNDFSESHARQAMDSALTASPRPQIITIQEAWQEFSWAYIDELQRQTGQTWYGVFQPLCPTGAWNGSWCTQAWDQVVGIMSTFPIVDSSVLFLPYADCWTSARVALRAALNVNGTTLQAFTTHLQTGGCTDSTTARYQSMSLIKSWASNYSTPQIFSGDFNADPDQIDSSSGMSPNFLDTWPLVGSGSRYTFSVPSPTMKLDYWFTDASMRAQPVSSSVVTSTGSVSDHLPVRTTFTIP
jgi:endonuclease/exonuclease/phosphatase family metal-dependent hydrolase